jgi:hypothetical protein
MSRLNLAMTCQYVGSRGLCVLATSQSSFSPRRPSVQQDLCGESDSLSQRNALCFCGAFSFFTFAHKSLLLENSREHPKSRLPTQNRVVEELWVSVPSTNKERWSRCVFQPPTALPRNQPGGPTRAKSVLTGLRPTNLWPDWNPPKSSRIGVTLYLLLHAVSHHLNFHMCPLTIKP